MSSDELDRVRRATVAKGAAEAEYRAAVLAAVTAGASYARVARAAGVSRQAVRQLAERSR